MEKRREVKRRKERRSEEERRGRGVVEKRRNVKGEASSCSLF